MCSLAQRTAAYAQQKAAHKWLEKWPVLFQSLHNRLSLDRHNAVSACMLASTPSTGQWRPHLGLLIGYYRVNCREGAARSPVEGWRQHRHTVPA